MVRPLAFYLFHSLRNQARVRALRFKQPKYLISGLAGLAYLYFAFVRTIVLRNGAGGIRNFRIDDAYLPLVEVAVALSLFLVVLLPWIFRSQATPLTFSEAEIQFLFPAPVSRKALLRFRMVRAQLGIAFGVLVSVLIFGRGALSSDPLYLVVTLWLVYSFLGLYRMGASLAKLSLVEHGVSGLRWQAGTLGILAAMIGAVLIWLRWFLPVPPPLPGTQLPGLLEWLREVAASGPAYYFLLPFRTLVRPALAQSNLEFLQRLVPAALIVALTYRWVLHTDANFQEAALDRSEEVMRKTEAAQRGAARVTRFKPAALRLPFRLDPRGSAATAFLWKNLIMANRFGPARIALGAAAIVVALVAAWAARGLAGGMIPTVIGSVACGIAGFLTLFGPVLQREDLRSDLLNLEIIKTYPVPGWSIVAGEVLAPAVVITASQLGLLVIAACLLPQPGSLELTPFRRVLLGLAAAFLLPCFSLIGLVIQNAAVLLIPGWMQLGKDQVRGIEAMGQRMVTMVATALVLAFAVIPAAILFAAAFFAGFRLLGFGIVPIAALLAALVLVVEAVIGIAALGRLFDRFEY